MEWISVYRKDTANVGDLMSSPRCFYDLPSFDITENIPPGNLIIGGGGLLIFSQLESIVRQAKADGHKVILWGLGQNTHGSRVPTFPDWLALCDLVGMRDYPSPFQWVPCASCMQPIFDQSFPIKRSIGFYSHHERERMGEGLTNDDPFEQVIEYLATSETIVTNCYHGCYWGSLLGRRVIVRPFSSRFFAMRHPPLILGPNDYWEDRLNETVVYPDALAQCRQANQDFYRQTLDTA
jgi:hypothetical protein